MITKERLIEIITDHSEPDNRFPNNGEKRHIEDNDFDDLAEAIIEELKKYE